MSLPQPPEPGRGDFTRQVSAWVTRTVDTTLLRAVPSLVEYPHAAGRTAWYATRAVIHARGQEDLGPISMSAAIPESALDGLLPGDDIRVLRGLQLDPSEAPGAEELRRRVAYLTQVGGRLPRHIYT